jgi:hypothetical protein
VLPLLCPVCAAEMRILAFVTEPLVLHRILRHLGLPAHPPPIAPARAPPQTDLDFDQSPAFDPSDGDLGPDFDFDQSRPDLDS